MTVGRDGTLSPGPGPWPRPGVAAIILAGGASARFGSDKLSAPYAGRPLLWHALAAVAAVADESILALARGAPIPALPPGPGPRVVRDPLPDAGPLVGLLAGLRSTCAAVAIVVAGDMPLLRAEVLRLLVERVVADEHVGAVTLLDGDRRRPLPCAVRVEPARVAADRLVVTGRRSLRSLLGSLAAEAVDEAEWRALDPDGSSLRDVDTPLDLERLEGATRRPPR